jgi:hypothetical protein
LRHFDAVCAISTPENSRRKLMGVDIPNPCVACSSQARGIFIFNYLTTILG